MIRFWRVDTVVVGTVAAACVALAGAMPAGSVATASAASGAVGAVGAAGAAGAAVARPAVMLTSATTARATPAYRPPGRTLRSGTRGSDVRALQQRLGQLKYYPGRVDGQFGPNTLEAVWAFQEVQGLAVDGVVGPATGHALVSPRAPRARDPRGGALRVEVNLSRRVLLLYRNNALALVSHVSTGGGYRYCSNGSCGYAITPTGHFKTTVFMPGWVTVPLGQMYNPVFFIGTAYAIHGDTYVPLAPVSHGCVRLPMDVAAFFHTQVRTPGTPVYIYR